MHLFRIGAVRFAEEITTFAIAVLEDWRNDLTNVSSLNSTIVVSIVTIELHLLEIVGLKEQSSNY